MAPRRGRARHAATASAHTQGRRSHARGRRTACARNASPRAAGGGAQPALPAGRAPRRNPAPDRRRGRGPARGARPNVDPRRRGVPRTRESRHDVRLDPGGPRGGPASPARTAPLSLRDGPDPVRPVRPRPAQVPPVPRALGQGRRSPRPAPVHGPRGASRARASPRPAPSRGGPCEAPGASPAEPRGHGGLRRSRVAARLHRAPPPRRVAHADLRPLPHRRGSRTWRRWTPISPPFASCRRVRPPRCARSASATPAASAEAIAAFRRLHPACEIVPGRRAALLAAIAGTDRVRVRTGGVCHRDPEMEIVRTELTTTAAIGELVSLLEPDECGGDRGCMCCGGPTFEFLAGEKPARRGEPSPHVHAAVARRYVARRRVPVGASAPGSRRLARAPWRAGASGGHRGRRTPRSAGPAPRRAPPRAPRRRTPRTREGRSRDRHRHAGLGRPAPGSSPTSTVASSSPSASGASRKRTRPTGWPVPPKTPCSPTRSRT